MAARRLKKTVAEQITQEVKDDLFPPENIGIEKEKDALKVPVMTEKAEITVRGPEDLDDLPLESVDDYRVYNRWARVFKKPVKFPPIEMHKHRKVRFTRSDNQRGNPLSVRRRDGESLIDFHMILEDGKEYDLPVPIINFINKLGVPRYKEVKYPDGTSETVFSHNEMRFACQAVYDE